MDSHVKLLDSLDEVYRRTGFDQNFMRTAIMHLLILEEYLIKKQIKTRGNFIQYLMSKFFIDHITEIYPNNRFICKLNEDFDWPITLYPSEAFSAETVPHEFRINDFFSNLKVADILDGKVIIIQGSEIHLKVIHKYGCNRLLEDLNIIVSLPRSRKEIALLGTDITKMDIIRVTVSEISGDVKKKIVKVTLDKCVLQASNPGVKLGKIKEKCLPAYVKKPHEVHKFGNLKCYLQSQIIFKNSIFFNKILSVLGLNSRKIYSFIPAFNCLNNQEHRVKYKQIYDKYQTYTEKKLLKEDHQNKNKNSNETQMHYHKAVTLLKDSLYLDSLAEINKALTLECNYAKLYAVKGEIYEKMEGTLLSKNAITNYAIAYYHDENNMIVRTQLSKFLSLVAVNFLRKKNYASALEAANKALFLNPNHKNASDLLQHLKKKQPNLFNDKDCAQINHSSIQMILTHRKQEPT